MHVAAGAGLVALTWMAITAMVMSAGLLPALLSRGSRTVEPARVLRYALWWGLSIFTLLALAANFFLPLRSGQIAVIFLGVILGLGIPGWIVMWKLTERSVTPIKMTLNQWVLIVGLGVALMYLAIAALGPVTNYDTGLYHLGAISYAGEFRTIPGLANIYFPLGYASSEFPLAALIGNGPWQSEGFRLLNGQLLVLVVVDLLLRTWEKRQGPAFYVLLAGLLATLVPMVSLSDYWMTSPTQDAAALILSIVIAAYLVEAIHGRDSRLPSCAVVTLVGIELVLIRTTMVAFAGAAIVIVAVLLARTAERPRTWPTFVLAVAIGGATFIASLIRDYLLSGWLLFPLSIFSFDVPWRAVDPLSERLATLGYHRDPENLWASIDGWNWLAPWLENRVTQWETYEFLGMAVVAVVLVVVAKRNTGSNLPFRPLLLAMLPSLVGVVAWFLVTPPSYRFIWGPLFTLAAIPIGTALWAIVDTGSISSKRRGKILAGTSAVMCIPILLVTAYSSLARLSLDSMTEPRSWDLGVSIPYRVAPLPEIDVRTEQTDSGLALIVPINTEQCWGRFPLCTPRPSAALESRGTGIESGFEIPQP